MHFKLEIGTFMQILKQHYKSLLLQTSGAIALGPHRDKQGSASSSNYTHRKE